jgi:glutamate-1-semialdehyde 2,1-aminomutase
MMLNSGGIPPREGYLEGLRDVCSQNGIVLIFDEVITGFRLSLAGAQGLYGVTPDIAVFAKAMASGFPLSAVVGRREIMSMISRGEVMHAGTYNSNPVVVAAALATLDELAGEDGAVYRQMTEVREHLEQGIVQLLIAKGIPAQVIGAGTMFYVTFTSLPAFRDYRESLNQDVAAYDRFLRALADRGVRTTSRGIWFLSGAHTIEDAEFTLNAVEEALSAM